MTGPSIKRIVLTVVGVLAILVGLLWMGQGLNVIPGSFMTGDAKWFVIGAVVAIVGVLLVLAGRGRKSVDPRV